MIFLDATMLFLHKLWFDQFINDALMTCFMHSIGEEQVLSLNHLGGEINMKPYISAALKFSEGRILSLCKMAWLHEVKGLNAE